MQASPGGAAAAPFKTFHNALGCEFYLRIALELYHKRLLVGGIDKLFEIGKNFRNEGLSRRHNPEFTMLEAYQAFGDYETMMEIVQSLICHVAQKILGNLCITHNRYPELASALMDICRAVSHCIAVVEGGPGGKLRELDSQILNDMHRLLPGGSNTLPSHELASTALILLKDATQQITSTAQNLTDARLKEAFAPIDSVRYRLELLALPKIIDLTPNWRRAKYKDLIREKAGADWFDISPAERRQRAHDLGAEIGKEYEDFEVTGAVFEKLIEPTLIQPTFVTHLPKELVPLAKLSPDDPTTVEVFECCINGQEISPGYTEQNDPIAQRATLEHQAGGEQQKLDDDFLTALEHGMPPAGGIGIGIDRLCMMLLGQESIRDVILFPQLKPK
jgi:lysyl-tRNA synthetase class 2